MAQSAHGHPRSETVTPAKKALRALGACETSSRVAVRSKLRKVFKVLVRRGVIDIPCSTPGCEAYLYDIFSVPHQNPSFHGYRERVFNEQPRVVQLDGGGIFVFMDCYESNRCIDGVMDFSSLCCAVGLKARFLHVGYEESSYTPSKKEMICASGGQEMHRGNMVGIVFTI